MDRILDQFHAEDAVLGFCRWDNTEERIKRMHVRPEVTVCMIRASVVWVTAQVDASLPVLRERTIHWYQPLSQYHV